MEIEEEIINIKDRLTNIENKLDKIIMLLNNNVIQNCEKMSEHIDFVDNVYQSVRKPLSYICSLTSSQNYPELPGNQS